MTTDMTVTVNGTRHLAERACRMVFGEDAGVGPVCPAPKPLLWALDNWPKDKTDQAIDLALELPIDFDIEKELGKGERKAIVIRACRVTVLHRGAKVGYAIRTNQLGLNAIAAWREANEVYMRKIRGAH